MLEKKFYAERNKDVYCNLAAFNKLLTVAKKNIGGYNMQLKFEVKRHRMSVTQGEAEVFVNGESIVRYGDKIVLNGEIDQFGGWGSLKEDKDFIMAAIKQYNNKILKIIGDDK